MLTVIEAKKIGIRACIDKLGYDFCKKYADNSTSAWGEIEEGIVNCFVGFNTDPAPICDINKVTKLILTHEKDWAYSACCNVYRATGDIEFIEIMTP